MRFEYLYVGLPGLDAVQYVQGDNLLGVALSALMRIPKDKVAWLGAEALRRLQAAPLTDQQRHLLAGCVQAYLPFDEVQKREFERLIASEPYQGVKAMNKTWYEEGVEVGIEKGKREAFRENLEDKFGPLPPPLLDKLVQLPMARIQQMKKQLWQATSLNELGLEE